MPAGKSAAEHHHHTDHASDSSVAAAATAVSETGAGIECPFFPGMPGVPSDPDPASVCAPAAALKKWAVLKFGLFLHWRA